MTINIEISKATNPDKKYQAVKQQPSGRTKTIQFGATGMSDYTKHKDSERKQRYLNRHKQKTGVTITQQGSMQQIFYGTSQPLQKA